MNNLKLIVDQLIIFSHNNNIKKLLIYLHGGEPTQLLCLEELIDYIKVTAVTNNIVVFFELQTNLIVDNKRLGNLISKIDMLNVSPHFSELKNKKSLLKIFDINFKYIIDNNIFIHNFDVMLEQLNDDEIIIFKKWIIPYIEYKNIMNCEMIYSYWRISANNELHDKYIDFYNKYNKTYQKYEVDGKYVYDTNQLFKQGLNCVGMKCQAGIKSFLLLGNGNIYHCGRPMTDHLKKQTSEKEYTNILFDKYAQIKLKILKSNGTICKSDECGGEYYLEKEII